MRERKDKGVSFRIGRVFLSRRGERVDSGRYPQNFTMLEAEKGKCAYEGDECKGLGEETKRSLIVRPS